MLYKDAGVNIKSAESALKNIKILAKKTFKKGVLSDIGSFGGLFDISQVKLKNPVLVSSTDSVGTKVKIASMAGKYKGIGMDMVSHSVNDILTLGAQPLFFLDYFASSRLDPEILVEIIEGISDACIENNCSLIGGETAELPGVYRQGEFDLVGTIIGSVEKEKIITGKNIQKGDILIGLSSSGLHTNGFSLARKIFFEKLNWDIDKYIPEISTTIGDVLLTVHRSYFSSVYPYLSTIKGIAHITGGGFYDNIPRILPKNLNVIITKKGWEIPFIFKLIQKYGDVPEEEMFHTFNMGIGMVLITDNISLLDKIDGSLKIGFVEKGNGRIIIRG